MSSILFVCTANRIRSVMAEALMKRHLSVLPAHDWVVESAGTWTRTGLTAMPLTIDVAREAGIDLTAHRSRSVDDVALDAYDLIVTMEIGQRDALRGEFAEVAEHVFTVGEVIDSVAYDVGDPIGGTIEEYRQTFRLLATLMERGADALLQKATSLNSSSAA